jgi:N-acetylmuramoyl-L-alanine amidase
MAKIAGIDPGHGGHDVGAIGPTGLTESSVNMTLARMLALRLCDDPTTVHPILSRQTDIYMSPSAKAAWANEVNCDLLISLHCNAFANPAANGFEVWTSPGLTDADSLATAMWLAFREDFPDRRPRLDERDGDPDKEGHLTVLTRTIMPAVLFEVAFISNPIEEELLRDDGWLWRVSSTLERSIRAWLSTRT